MPQPQIPPSHNKILLLGDTPTETDALSHQLFSDAAGRTLRQALSAAGIQYSQCLVTNVSLSRCKTHTSTKWDVATPEYQQGIDNLKYLIRKEKPHIIVPLSSKALHLLTGQKSIKNFRGTLLPCTLLPGLKVLPTHPPGSAFYEWVFYYQMVLDFRKIKIESLTATFPEDQRILEVAPPKHRAVEYLTYLYDNRDTLDIAIDLEHTTPGAHISWFGITHSENFGMAIQFIKNRTPCFPESDEIEIWSAISKLCNSEIKQVYHNASYDVANLWYNQGVWCSNVHFDTILAAHTIWPEFPRDLGFLSSILLTVPAWKHTSGNQYEHGEYNAADAANTMGIYLRLKKVINSDENFISTFQREMEQLRLTAYMQLNGVHVDLDTQQTLSAKFTIEMNRIQSGLSKILDRDINLNSPTQLADLLYTDLGLPTQYKRRAKATGPRKVTTDKDALKKLFNKTKDPILKLILEYRKYTKILQFTNVQTSPESKVHTSYNIAGTTTGRWSSSKSIIRTYGSGNLQNIDKRVRQMYYPPKGYVILQADYVGAEAHVVSHMIQDHRLIKAFDEGIDVHKLTASFMFQIDIEDVTPEQRKVGKTLRHGVNYSAGPGVLASWLGITQGEAARYLSDFHNTTPQLKIWHESIKAQLTKNRTLITPLGRKRSFMGKWGDTLFRSAFAFIPQSTIGDLLNISFVDFYQKHKHELHMGSYMQLHDAIYVWCREEDVSHWCKELHNSMHRPIHMPHTDLYVGVDYEAGSSWADMETVKL